MLYLNITKPDGELVERIPIYHANEFPTEPRPDNQDECYSTRVGGQFLLDAIRQAARVGDDYLKENGLL